jgi:hypothetical protein
LRFPFTSVALLAVVTLLPSPARAQGTLSTVVIDLLANGVVSDRGDNSSLAVNPNHEGHFLLRENAPAVFINGALFSQAIATQLSSFPLGSATGGFTYEIDPDTAALKRSTQSFGPSFVERSVTQGKRRWSFGVNYQHGSYDTFEDKDLRDGSIKFYLEHNDCCPAPARPDAVDPSKNPFFEGDIVEAALSVRLKTDLTLLFANYGLTDRIDVGLVVPFTSVDLQAENSATIIRLASADNPEIHRFDSSNSNHAVFSRGGSKTGIGDVAVRSKWNFLRRQRSGLAVALEARLPTGDDENLLGSGAWQGRLALMGSATSGRTSFHANAGYRVTQNKRESSVVVPTENGNRIIPLSSDVDLNPDEFSYGGAVDVAATPKLTVAGELFGRVLRNAGRLQDVPKSFAFRLRTDPAPPAPAPRSVTFSQLDLVTGSLHQAFGAASVKYNVTKTLLLSANVLFPVTKTGLRDRVTPVVSLDYTFGGR